MGVQERLSLEAISEHSLIACTHIHRYRLAAELVSGLRVLDLGCGVGYGSEIMASVAASVHGVDSDAATVDTAARTIGARTSATFEVADAVAYLQEGLADRFDVVVCFEALEHFDDPEIAIAGFRKQAKYGLGLILSVPNSRAFEEENEFHRSQFGYLEAVALADSIPNTVMINQYLTEGSLISAEQAADDLDATLENLEQAESEYANHFILVTNLDHDLATRLSARAQILEAPTHNRYMRSLEQGNRELLRRNNELARKMMGGQSPSTSKVDSAAVAFVASLKDRIATLEESIMTQETELVAELAQREEMILAQRREILEIRQQVLAVAAPIDHPGFLARIKQRLRV
jgi:2-polyprenyl-3-methyl-5-hydroxy-6-metoxy-1,4-benzoquinol methylase